MTSDIVFLKIIILNNKEVFMRNTKRGFTLMEIMVVIAIIGLLSVLVVPSVVENIRKAKVTTARAKMQQIQEAIQFYYLDNNKYPKALEDLTEPGKSYPNGYIDDIPLDPWDHEYKYRVSGGKYELISLGSDGEEGGESDAEDIKFPEKKKKP